MAYENRLVTSDAVAVTPGATEQPGYGFYVAVAGDVTVTTQAGTSTTFTAVPAGSIIPVAFTKITAATATGIVRFV
jgi:hypothetical protein